MNERDQLRKARGRLVRLVNEDRETSQRVFDSITSVSMKGEVITRHRHYVSGINQGYSIVCESLGFPYQEIKSELKTD